MQSLERSLLTSLVLSLSVVSLLVACGPTPQVGGGKATSTDPGFDPSTDGTDSPTDGPDGTDATNATDSTDPNNPATTDPGSTDATEPGSDPSPVYDGLVGFPSDELFLQIVGPDAEPHVATGGSITYMAGILFGNAAKIIWQSSSGETGEAEGGRFWKTGPIALSPGDNTVVVKAIGENGEESVDNVVVTYNPGFYFDTRPLIRPRGFFTGEDVDVVVTVGIPIKNVVPSTIKLLEVDDVGNTVGQIGTMIDNGDTSNPNCDEIQDDGVYSRCVTMQSATPTTRYVRVSLQIQAGSALHTVFSPVVAIEIVDPLSTSDCQQMHQVQKDARALWDTELAAGNGSPGAAVVQMLQSNPLVAAAGMNPDGYGVWTEFKGGILGGLNISTPGNRGGDAGSGDGGYGTQTGAILGNVHPIESKNVLALSPFNQGFGAADEVPQMASMMSDQVCPEYQIDGPHHNSASTLAKLRRAYEYGVLLYSGHGDVFFTGMETARKTALGWEHDGSQEVIWSGDPIDCGSLSSSMPTCSDDSECPGDSECVVTKASGNTVQGLCVDHTQIDARRGRVILGDSTWGVHPQFFARHARRKWPSSLVYLGACRTLFNGTMAGALFGVGAKAIAGFTDYVRGAFASEQALTWMTAMLEEKEASGTATLFPVVDPENPAGQFALFGGSNVVITDADILNAGFEKGDTTGWNVDGDGRVIGKLGISIPVGGKFMGILSTGLGYTQQTGELNQSFCIPEGVQKLTFYWKFFSEEFLEWCGSVYQDTFQATLESGSGQLKLVDVKVDDLCAPSDCPGGCGAQYVGLIPADVSFDQGGVYNTQWQELTKSVTSLAGGGPVTLRLFATDQGDSIYDTVILVDSITFE